MTKLTKSNLAIEGGAPVFKKGLSPRGLIGPQEKAAAMKVFDEAIKKGAAFGYNGEHEQRYENAFVKMMGGGFADGVSSGTNAVYVALGALRLPPFSEVIVSAITDSGGIMPIPLLGCVPVVADCDPRSFNTSAKYIEPLITKRTRAIIIAHIAGEVVDMDPIMKLARKHSLYVVEDCAQSHGATYKGRLTGTIGDIAAFSTMFGKHHCTGAQGGVVYTRNEDLYWQAKRFADRGKPFGLAPETGNVVAGLNCNSNELAAAIGLIQLRKLPNIVAKRRAIGEALRKQLAGGPIVTVGWQLPNTEGSYWFMRLHFNAKKSKVDKAAFCKALQAEGIPLETDYEAIPAVRPWFTKQMIFGAGGFPWNCSDYKGPRKPVCEITNARQAIAEHFKIYIHERLSAKEVNGIVAAIKKIEKAYAK